MVDTEGYEAIQKAALETKEAVDIGAWNAATNLWGMAENVVMRATGNIDFYNILTKVKGNRYGRQARYRDAKSDSQGELLIIYTFRSFIIMFKHGI